MGEVDSHCPEWECVTPPLMTANATELKTADLRDQLRVERRGRYRVTMFNGKGAPLEWIGDVDSQLDFAFATCSCDALSANSRFCLRSHCDASAAAYHFPAPLYAFLHLFLLMVPCLCCCHLAFNEDGTIKGENETMNPDEENGRCCFWCANLVFIIGFSVLFPWLGGSLEIYIVIAVLGAIAAAYRVRGAIADKGCCSTPSSSATKAAAKSIHRMHSSGRELGRAASRKGKSWRATVKWSSSSTSSAEAGVTAPTYDGVV